MAKPITDEEIEIFQQMHKCPNTHLDGSCHKCSMVARIEQLKAQLILSNLERDDARKSYSKVASYLKEARKSFPES